MIALVNVSTSLSCDPLISPNQAVESGRDDTITWSQAIPEKTSGVQRLDHIRVLPDLNDENAVSELILHIGAHKTATTALQKTLSQSDRHLARNGIIYPRLSWFQFAQHRLAFGLKNMRDPARGDHPDPLEEIAQLNSFLTQNPGRRILISSEELFTLRPEALDLLQANLVAPKIKIIACVRRPDEMLLSIYNQKAKTPNNGFSLPLGHFLQKPRTIDPDIAYGQQLGKWIDRFGVETLSVFTYEEAPLIENFFRLLGMDSPTCREPAVNRSVPAPVVEIMRIAKANKMDAALQPTLYHLALKQFSDAPKLSMTHEQRKKILQILRGEYDALFARLGRENPYPPELLTSAPEEAPLPPPLTFRDMLALIEKLMRS